jgi:2'-5' RNA ligase
MRVFLGLAPPVETQQAIQAWRDKTFTTLERPVLDTNLHVTLAFLGQISSEQQHQLQRLINHLPAQSAFNVDLDTLGYWAKPKALWLGCQTPQSSHIQLAENLIRIASRLAIPSTHQTYRPHLTLARKCARPLSMPIIRSALTWRALQFHLFESVSGQQGVKYHIRHSWPLHSQV